MAENEKAGGATPAVKEKETGATASAKKETAKYDSEFEKKYEVLEASVQPAKIDFGRNWGGVEIDLRAAGCAAKVDAFVKKYNGKDGVPMQPFFKAK